MHLKDIPQIIQLSIPEKMLLVEELLESIYAAEVDVAIPHDHISELENRLSRHTTNPDDLLSFEELRKGIELRK